MIGFYNQDTSFFEIKTKKSTTDNQLMNNLTDRIISFSLTEEMNKIFNGSISMYDPYNDNLDMILYPGQELEIAWGYKRPDSSLLSAFTNKSKPQELSGPFKRFGLKAYIMNPSGGGDAQGVITYNATFMGSEAYTGAKAKCYNNMNKIQVCQEVLTRMGVLPENQFINFGRMNEVIAGDTQYIQYESNFQFMTRIAFENQTNFTVGQGPNGSIAVVADFNTPEMNSFVNKVGNSMGTTVTMNYKKGAANVESYTWEHNVSDGAGDNVQITYIGREPVFRRFQASNSSLVDYKINMDKIKKDIKEHPGKTQTEFVAELMKINKFSVLVEKGYFTPYNTTLAPQGYGWHFKVKMLGNPMITSPTRVELGDGFPNLVNPSGSLYTQKSNLWVRAVTHTVDMSGYHMELDIVDAFTLMGGSFVM